MIYKFYCTIYIYKHLPPQSQLIANDRCLIITPALVTDGRPNTVSYYLYPPHGRCISVDYPNHLKNIFTDF